MLSHKVRNLVKLLLIFLIVKDIILFNLCFFFPDTWFKIFHDAPYIDPQGLLQRTGAVWLAFTLLQIIAFLRWERHPYWLTVIAGVRLTEIFSDWVYIYVATSMTWYGRLGLSVAPPGNLAFGWFLIWVYQRMMRERGGPEVT
jgi:hypothetical protein